MFSQFKSLFNNNQDSNVAVAEKPAAPPVAQTAAPPLKTKAAEPPKPPKTSDKSLTEKYRDGLTTGTPIWSNADSVEDKDLVIRAAYKQIFGNAHVMDSERLVKAESQLRFGEISVRDFIRELAVGGRYQALFWEKYPTSTFIELNFKHFLGRAPQNQEEVRQHTKILREDGFEAEIDSYLNSDEYYVNFGEHIVPYFRGYSSQVGQDVVAFTHAFTLANMACSSDKSVLNSDTPRLQLNLINKQASEIPAVRPIPDSYPSDFLPPARPPRLPSELIVMARKILQERTGSEEIYSETLSLYVKS
ncbi:Phycobilisome linker polypeptide [[Leptolyngbya] sp. PCC 7376]|uniref:phycobilisome rod-core linker polypeptide n=1 Tax=[Leptolyngbya] sp. PCC 7376 TaxID=111781 RepID=UPI00029ED3B5|nr:phycobilisome rod-core linker polypeptide [[Leptolyngbya] sp. PCC 7376]AFY38839.1 Phycobilisome linker polypeptide [[Leptolyngbya] sp. PCC 7376]